MQLIKGMQVIWATQVIQDIKVIQAKQIIQAMQVMKVGLAQQWVDPRAISFYQNSDFVQSNEFYLQPPSRAIKPIGELIPKTGGYVSKALKWLSIYHFIFVTERAYGKSVRCISKWVEIRSGHADFFWQAHMCFDLCALRIVHRIFNFCCRASTDYQEAVSDYNFYCPQGKRRGLVF